MKITFKNGNEKIFDKPMTCKELATSFSESFSKKALIAKVDDVLVDLDFLLESDSKVEILTFDDQEGRNAYCHSCSHILALAVKNLYPTCKLAIGPNTQNGFYYDFEFQTPISNDDLSKIEAEMKKIIKANLPFSHTVKTRTEANNYMKKLNQPYKSELVASVPRGSKIYFYQVGDFVDLCKGPHIPSTGYIKAFKLTSVTGAYWRGDSKNVMLTRIYGNAFDRKDKLEAYVKQLEELKLRDHNKIGRELNIFMTDEDVGQGLPLFMPKGAKILRLLQRFVEDLEEESGYLITKTPLMAKSELYKKSGHWYKYRDKMFILSDSETDSDNVYALRPMSCPFHFKIYNNGVKSYNDLPVRYSETATLFRKEASGELHGLTRIREFTLSDGHIMCTPTQFENEFANCLNLITYFIDCLGISSLVSYRFSKWDAKDKKKYIQDADTWAIAQSAVRKVIDDMKLNYVESEGEAAFYGPKLDVQAKNVYGKKDTIFTIQVDLFSAKAFDMYYVDKKGERKHPYIIHRSSLGCYERTLALLIEHYSGALPLWLSPEQVRVMSLTERTISEAQKFVAELKKYGIRAVDDVRNEKLNYKIREAEVEKVPYSVIIGDKDKEDGVIAVRKRGVGDMGVMTEDEFVSMIVKQNAEKTIF